MFNIKEELKRIPEKPGVYIMKDIEDNILYVGKAIILKNRVRQYFQKNNKSSRIEKMVSQIDHFEYIVVDSEMEALILECNLIKLHRPKYNVLLKDDKMYPYIKVTLNDYYPMIRITRKKVNDGAKYYGPYTNGLATKDTVDFLNQTFKLKQCKKTFNKDSKESPCLYFHIKRCMGPCTGNIPKEEYDRVIKNVMLFLDGKVDSVLKELDEEIKNAARNMNYEKAALLRDKKFSIENLSQRQKIESYNENDIDVIGVKKVLNKAALEVFRIRSGKMIGGENYIFNDIEDFDEGTIISNFIKQFYAEDNIPNKIFFRYEFEDLELIRERLIYMNKGKNVEFKIPQKGEKMRFIEMAEKNALIALQNKTDVIEHESIISKIKNLLAMDELPRRIESYDISNISGTDAVAGIVVFENGKPKKNEYRRIKIKTVVGQNDIMCLKEALERRLKYLLEENEKTEKNPYGPRPNLILMDGGIAQVRAAKEVLKKLKLEIHIYGLVKNNKHRTRGIIDSNGNELEITDSEILNFITYIQDEVHRTAIEYHRKLRDSKTNKSVLDDINGIGDKKKSILLKEFKSVKKISELTYEELIKVKGIDQKSARNVYDFFHLH